MDKVRVRCNGFKHFRFEILYVFQNTYTRKNVFCFFPQTIIIKLNTKLTKLVGFCPEKMISNAI